MKALIQRVLSASVKVDNQIVANIRNGLLILIGIRTDDTQEDIDYLVDKTINLRIFSDESGKFNLSALDVAAELLIVSQFTLYGNIRRGRRPSFSAAATPEYAWPFFETIVDLFRTTGLNVETGRFQENMVVSSENNGPVTIIIETNDRNVSKKTKLI